MEQLQPITQGQDRSKQYQGNENIHLIIKGAFEYIHNDRVFSEENFLVFRNTKDNSIIFDSELLTRLDTGEFLKVYVNYQINKDWVPIDVVIDKQAGKQVAQERFKMDIKRNVLSYQFAINKDKKEFKIQVPPKFQISTINTVTSFAFISSKKYDPTGKNFYNVLVSDNILDYRTPPKMNYVLMERIGTSIQKLKIKDKTLKAMLYKVYSQDGFDNQTEPPITIWVSKYYSIPYLIEAHNDTKIQIKFLNEVDVSEIACAANEH
ncbi:MAG: hypothetical protein HQK51_05060 [Oligoflexia bacterium]|nr:hypothetical protein [Oligoflexia bacterium]